MGFVGHMMTTRGKSPFNHPELFTRTLLESVARHRIKRGEGGEREKKKTMGESIKPLLLFKHQQRRKKTAKSGRVCVLPYICVVPASCVTACSRDGTPWERGADSLTCRCLRPTCASNLVVTWGGGGGRRKGRRVGESVMMIMKGVSSVIRVCRGANWRAARSKKKGTYNGISRTFG